MMNSTMNKEFDCVEMKHRAAATIQKKMAGFTTEEGLAFWNNQTRSVKEYQKQLIETEKAKP